jgi:hypothetical protein
MRKLTKLFRTLFLSAPALLNIGTLLLLLMIVCALFAVQLFADVRGTIPQIQAGLAEDFEFVNSDANFESFGIALFTMFRCVTGESWNGIMHDCYRVSQPVAIVFFIAFYVIGNVLFLNLFIAIILENFADVAEEYEAPVTPTHLAAFVEAWGKIDLRLEPERTAPSYTAETYSIVSLLMAMPPPLGLRGTDSNCAMTLQRVRELAIPDHDGLVHMHEVVYALTAHACTVPPVVGAHEARIDARVARAFPQLHDLRSTRPALKDASHFYAAAYVQASWRGFAARDYHASDWAQPEPTPLTRPRAHGDGLTAIRPQSTAECAGSDEDESRARRATARKAPDRGAASARGGDAALPNVVVTLSPSQKAGVKALGRLGEHDAPALAPVDPPSQRATNAGVDSHRQQQSLARSKSGAGMSA